MARRGKARHGAAWLVRDRQGKVRQGSAGTGAARLGKARFGVVRQGKARQHFLNRVINSKSTLIN